MIYPLRCFVPLFAIAALCASGAEYFVDRGAPGPLHDGLSWTTAWTNIRSAARSALAPGDIVWIRPGAYPERLAITNSGDVLLQATNLLGIGFSNQVRFPPEVDFTPFIHETGLAVAIYRSLHHNHGIFDVSAIDASNRIVYVHGRLHDEAPWAGDAFPLRAALLKPIRWRNAGPDPETNRVVIDASSIANPSTVFYVGLPIGDGSADAWPADAHVFEHLDITGSTNGSGVHLQCGNYNTFIGCRFFETAKPGMIIAGNTNRPARYNMLWRCAAWNTPYETVYIGAGGQGWDRNHAYFTHVLDSEFFTTTGARALMENAVDIKEGNFGSVVAGNVFRDARLVTGGNGLVDVRPRADHTWILGNRFLAFEAGAGSSPRAAVMVYASNRAVRIANNLIVTASASNTLAGLRLQEGHQQDNQFVFNTVVGPHRGALYEYYSGATGGWLIANNIWDARSTPFTVWGSQGGIGLSHNLYSSNPPSEYAGEPGRLIAAPLFRDRSAGDFRLMSNSPAVNSAIAIEPYELDLNGYLRDHSPDRGAHEFDDPRLIFDPALPTRDAVGDAFQLAWKSRIPEGVGAVRWYLRPVSSTNRIEIAAATAGRETNAWFSLWPFAAGDYFLMAEVVEANGQTNLYVAADPLQALGDADTDQLPAWWESLYFGGPTQALAQTAASNGINTILESFIAGLNPLRSDSFFEASIAPDQDDIVLSWTPLVKGRVYEIMTTTNAGLPYLAFATNLSTNRHAMVPGEGINFYRLSVKLAP